MAEREWMQEGIDGKLLFLLFIRKMWIVVLSVVIGSIITTAIYMLTHVVYAPAREYRAQYKYYLEFNVDENGDGEPDYYHKINDKHFTEEFSDELADDDIIEGVGITKTPVYIIENRRKAIEYALQKAQKNDIILLAGKGHETYQIIGDEKISFDERKTVADFLK